jgi:hypothetical protein
VAHLTGTDSEAAVIENLPDTSVLTTDLVSFTKLAGQISPSLLFEYLNDLYRTFDRLLATPAYSSVVKIDTIGTAFVVSVLSFAFCLIGSCGV